MKLAIYGSRRQEQYLPQIEAFLMDLSSRGDEVVLHSKFYNYLSHTMPRALACVRRVTDVSDFTADYVISLGGDGSFLRTAAWIGKMQIPVIGVNTGHLGFLASLGVEDLLELPQQLLSGNSVVEDRSLIAVGCPHIKGWNYALNDVALTRSESSSIISVNARVDGVELADYRADGLIVATPTGSTAYNMSVGGPIAHPTAPVFVISPIAAHSLSMRPLVVGDQSQIELTVDSRTPHFQLSIDGRSSILELSSKIVLRKADFVVKVVRLPGHDFANTLRNKLMWR